MHRRDRRQLARLNMAKLPQLRRPRLNNERVPLNRDPHHDDVLDAGEASPRCAPNNPRREVHQSTPLMPHRRDQRQVTTRRKNMPRILQEPAQLRRAERRPLRPAQRTRDQRRIDRPSRFRIRRKPRDQQLNPPRETEQSFPKLMRTVRAQPHRRPLIRRKHLPQTTDKMLCDRKRGTHPTPAAPSPPPPRAPSRSS
jgi:hypothetical protein